MPNRLRRALEAADNVGTAHEVCFTCPYNQARRKVEWLSFACNFSVHKNVPKDLSVNSNEDLPPKSGDTEILVLSDEDKAFDRMDMLI